MKKLLLATVFAFISYLGFSQNGSKPSPATETKATLTNGAEISIKYGQPSLKGRTPGKDVEPMLNKIWRAGANDATVFETSKDLKINGNILPAGKYALFILQKADGATIIFNKIWKQWGAFQYKEAEDALRVPATLTNNTETAEKLVYSINTKGMVQLLWGNLNFGFTVE